MTYVSSLGYVLTYIKGLMAANINGCFIDMLLGHTMFITKLCGMHL